MRKVVFILFLSCFLFNLSAVDSVKQLRTSLHKLKGIEKANILYKLASKSDSLEITEKIEYCAQAKEIALNFDNNELLFDILSLESKIFIETKNIEKYSLTMEEYIELYKKITRLETISYEKQVSKQIKIRNSFIIGFLIILNIAFIVFARYRIKTGDQIKLERANKQLDEL